MGTKQPTATAFVRKQESWSQHLIGKLEQEIADREALLLAEGKTPDDLDQDTTLLDLYDDVIFHERYVVELAKQRTYLHETYLGEGSAYARGE